MGSSKSVLYKEIPRKLYETLNKAALGGIVYLAHPHCELYEGAEL